MAAHDDQPGFVIDPVTTAAYRADIETALPSFRQSQRVLEPGCGSGVFTQFLVAQGLMVIGMDKNETQLIEARQRLPDTSFLSADFTTSDFATRLLSNEQRFDLIATRYVIHELSDPIETFLSWKHLLRPDGRLLLIENAWIRCDWGWSDWGIRSDQLPLSCTQTWATAVYCLEKAGFNVTACAWMQQVNQLQTIRLLDGFRLYALVAQAVN